MTSKISSSTSISNYSDRLVSVADIVISLFLGMFFTILINISYITKILSNDNTNIQELITEESSRILTQLDFSSTFSRFGSIATTAFVWAIIGMAVYIVAHFLFSLFGAAEEGVVVSRSYIHPKNYSSFSFWVSILSFILYPILLISLLIIWVIFTISHLIPLSKIVLQIALYDGGSIIYTALYIIMSVMIVSFAVLGFILLTKLLHQIGKIFI